MPTSQRPGALRANELRMQWRCIGCTATAVPVQS